MATTKKKTVDETRYKPKSERMPKREVNKALKEISEQANRNMNYRFVLEYLDKKISRV